MLPRRFYLIEEEKLAQIRPHFAAVQGALWVGDEAPPFVCARCSPAHAANLLGQEFPLILFDGRKGFHAEAFAMAAGTVRAGGSLILLIRDWATWVEQPDADSLRWHNSAQPFATPRFRRHIQACFQRHGIRLNRLPELKQAAPPLPKGFTPTAEQQMIIDHILDRRADQYFLTAKRGRGKSALMGQFARRLQARGDAVFVCAPNKSAVRILQVFAQTPLTFIAPDALCAAVAEDPAQFAQAWLLVDEAAMLPLDMLAQLTQSFAHLVFSTTVHGYEGTGRGFALKFMSKTDRTFTALSLQTPLRWAENDPLEALVDDILLFNLAAQPAPTQNAAAVDYRRYSPAQLPLATLIDCYTLLSLAHYRTTPADLRRLFDAPGQQLWLATAAKPVGCCWTLEEGGLTDADLIKAICQGVRRPKGNLAAQLLAFQSLDPAFCRLRSRRISRIAVSPSAQQQGIGSALLAQVLADCPHLDFISVSFGYREDLGRFWRRAGFVLLHLSEYKEAGSGEYTALMVRPVSPAGKAACEGAQERVERDLPLSSHPLAAQVCHRAEDWTMREADWQSLKNFADFNRTLSAALPAIRRFMRAFPDMSLPLLQDYLQQQKIPLGHKPWLANARAELRQALRQINNPFL